MKNKKRQALCGKKDYSVRNFTSFLTTAREMLKKQREKS